MIHKNFIFVYHFNLVNEFSRILVKKEHLLPLFSFDPALYEDIITTTAFEEKKNQQPMTLKQVRNKWKKL
jgi:hypothetical protein